MIGGGNCGTGFNSGNTLVKHRIMIKYCILFSFALLQLYCSNSSREKGSEIKAGGDSAKSDNSTKNDAVKPKTAGDGQQSSTSGSEIRTSEAGEKNLNEKGNQPANNSVADGQQENNKKIPGQTNPT